MNRNIASALVLAAAAVGNAFADDITIDPTPFVSSKSRAEVKAELKQYQQAGVDLWAQNYDHLASFTSVKSRSQVVAEYSANRAAVAAFNGEDSGSVYLAQGGIRSNGSVRYASSIAR